MARQRALLSVNKELLQVYWEIGSVILEQQKDAGWGSKIIDRLSADLRTEFPDFKGFSVRNLNICGHLRSLPCICAAGCCTNGNKKVGHETINEMENDN